MSRSRKRKGGRQTSGKKEFGWKRVSHRRGNGTHLCTLVPEEIAFCGLPPPLPEELGAPVIKKGERGEDARQGNVVKEVNQI